MPEVLVRVCNECEVHVVSMVSVWRVNARCVGEGMR